VVPPLAGFLLLAVLGSVASVLYAFLKLLTVFDISPGSMFQASTTLFEKKLWWQVEKNGIPMEEEEEEEVSERKQIFYVIKNFGLDPDPDWATAWIRICNTGPAGCNARFHITFSCLIIVMVGWEERYSHGEGRRGGGSRSGSGSATLDLPVVTLDFTSLSLA
jgi:hypothetical protein